MNQRNNIIKTIVSVCLAVITVVVVAIGVYINCIGDGNFRHFSFASGRSAKVSDEVTFSEDIEKIDVKLEAADVRVVLGNKWSVSYEMSENCVPDIRVNGNSLEVISKNKFFLLDFNSTKDNSVVITIPKNAELKDADVELDYGRLVIDELVANDVVIQADCGDVDLSALSSNSIKVCADCGSVDLDTFSGKTVSVEADCGKVAVENAKCDKIDVVADCGDVDIKDIDCENVYVEEDCGRVYVDGKFNYVKIENSLGDVEVNSENEDAEYDIDSDLGKVYVNGNNWKDSL